MRQKVRVGFVETISPGLSASSKMTSYSWVMRWDWVNKKLSVAFRLNFGMICEDFVKAVLFAPIKFAVQFNCFVRQAWEIILSIFRYSKAHSIIDWFTSWWERRDGTAGVLGQWSDIGNKIKEMNNLTSVVFAPGFNLQFSFDCTVLEGQNSATSFFQPITSATNLKPIVNSYRSYSLVLSYRIIISWAYAFNVLLCLESTMLMFSRL